MGRHNDDARRSRNVPRTVACEKAGFDSYRLAVEIAARARRHRSSTRTVAAYRCGHCGAYHLGHNRRLKTELSEL